MTREEAKTVFLNRGYVEVEGGTIYDADKWRESCRVISEWLEQEPSKDMGEIEEVINCDADAEIKLKMISNIVHSKPHYFKTSRENKIIDEHYWKGFSNGIRTAEWRATKQESTVTSTEDNAEMIYPQVEGITPTVVEPLPNVEKEVEKYKKMLKHPVIKSIMGMDETQEQLDFVQPHKRIPVTLTVESDCISRQEAIDTIRQLYIDLAIQKYVIDILKALPSVKPQESCDVPDTNVGDIISKQTVLDTISELNAISFYEAQEDSKECYYELRQAIKDLSPVKQEPKTVIYSGDGYADGYMVYDMAECPNCGYEYEDGDKDWGLPFCPNCGQKLNWERSDKE